MNDLLPELGTSKQSSISDIDSIEFRSAVSVSATQSRLEPVYHAIDTLKNTADRVSKLCKIKMSGLPSEQKKTLHEMDKIQSGTATLIRQATQVLDKEEANLKAIRGTTERMLYTNMYNSCVRSFTESITRFQKEVDKFHQAVQKDFSRQAKIINRHVSEKQIEEMLESEDPAKYLQTQLLASSPHRQMVMEELAELEAEHQRCKKLESTIAEIEELWQTCAMLVAAGGEKLDSIEQNVDNTLVSAQEGKKQVEEAAHYAVETRKLKAKTYIFVAIVAVIALLLVYLMLFR